MVVAGPRRPRAVAAGEAWDLADTAEAGLAAVAVVVAAAVFEVVVDSVGRARRNSTPRNNTGIWRRIGYVYPIGFVILGLGFPDDVHALGGNHLAGLCNKPEKTATTAVVQKTFASPAEAGAAFLEAAKSGDQSALLAILRSRWQECPLTGDAVKDKDALQDFVAAYDQMHRWREIKAGGEMLYIGADNFPFPIPREKSSGQWSFDIAAGKDEILARRIGKDELTAIAACGAVADAQQVLQPDSRWRRSEAIRPEICQQMKANKTGCTGMFQTVSLQARLAARRFR